MKLWQKISVIFFMGAITIFSPSANAGGDFDSGEPPPKETITTPPVKFDENSTGKNNPEDNKDHIEPPKDNPNTNNENPPASDNKKIQEKPATPVTPPKENQNILDETFNEDETDFEDTVYSGVLGDINNDGELNAIDLVVLQKYLKGDAFEINETEADINGDGTISNFDVFALLNLIKAEKKGTGDVNNDGKVDIYDVQTLTAYLADPNNTPINISNSDLTGDGRISTDDLKILKAVISELQQ